LAAEIGDEVERRHGADQRPGIGDRRVLSLEEIGWQAAVIASPTAC
jgi:hypothetical protein